MSGDEKPSQSGPLGMLREVGSLLAEMPGVAKAVAKLVGSGAQAGSAWVDVATAKGEARSQQVRDTTAAATQVRQAMVKAAIDQISGDPELGRRALEHFSEEIVGKQINREAVTQLALQDLSRAGGNQSASEEPSDDWLNIFSSYAERASSQVVREHWAAILAHEIRKPGSVSLVALKMMSVIDANFANIISKYKRYVLFADGGGSIPSLGHFTQSPQYDEFLALDSVGFLTIGEHSVNDQQFRMGKFILQPASQMNNHGFEAFVLTRAGIELVNLLGQEASLDDAIFIQDLINSNFTCKFVVVDSVDVRIVSEYRGSAGAHSQQPEASEDDE